MSCHRLARLALTRTAQDAVFVFAFVQPVAAAAP